MNKKSFIRAMLAIVMAAAMLPAMQRIALAEAYGDFEYSIEDGGVVIKGYKGNAAAVEIPANIEGVPVKAIGAWAFAFTGKFESMTIPDGVVSIGEYAFAQCGNLKTLTIPTSLTSIGAYAFSWCGSLKSITILASVVSIGEEAFEHCSLAVYCEENSVAQLYCDKYDILYVTGKEPGFSKPMMAPYFDSTKVNPQSITTATTANTTEDDYGLHNWAYGPHVQTVINPNGNVSVLNKNVDDRGRIYIYEYSSTGEYIKEVGFTPELPMIGAFTKDKDGNYYILYGKSVEEGQLNETNIILVKYSPNGVKQMDFIRTAADLNTRIPFEAGCRLEISGDKIAAYYARIMIDWGVGHQSSTGFILDINTFEWLSGPDRGDDMVIRRIPYSSHSFNQFILPKAYGNFVLVDHGDSYPRRFYFNTANRGIEAFEFYGPTGQNATYAEMGGLAAMTDGYIFVGTYEKNRPAEDVRNMFVLTMDKALQSISEPIWLTNFSSSSKSNVVAPKIVQIEEDNFLIMWMVGTNTYSMIVDGKGNVLSPQKKLASGILLNRYDVLRYNPVNGLVYWGVSDGDKKVRLYALDPLPGTASTPTSGAAVSGKIKSYNPQNKTTLQLLDGDSIVYETETAPTTGTGQLEQGFSFLGVQPGTYTLRLTKAIHAAYTVQNIIVGNEDIDLTEDPREGAKLIQMVCGDLNGDGSVNQQDLAILWSSANYMKSAEQAANPLADLDGDGSVNQNDLAILWSSKNYMQGAKETR